MKPWMKRVHKYLNSAVNRDITPERAQLMIIQELLTQVATLEHKVEQLEKRG